MLKKTSLIVLLSIILIASASGFCFAKKELEIKYPEVPGAITPVTAGIPLPDYVKYIFNFAIIIGGLIALVMIILGGTRYMASAGNPSLMADARDQIFSAIIGLFLLLGSYLILTTINPQLTTVTPVRTEIKEGITFLDKEGEEKTFLSSYPDLGDFEPISYKFEADPEDLKVTVYPERHFKGNGALLSSRTGSLPFIPKSVKLEWQLPGVYLCKEDGDCLWTDHDIDILPPEFEDKITFVKFKHITFEKNGEKETTARYEVILHENRGRWGDAARPFLAEPGIKREVSLPSGKGISSATINLFPTKTSSGVFQGAVTLYEKPDYNNHKDCREGKCKELQLKGIGTSNLDFWAGSIKISPEGKYLALVCNKPEGMKNRRCEVFRSSHPALSHTTLGEWYGKIGFLGGRAAHISSVYLSRMK